MLSNLKALLDSIKELSFSRQRTRVRRSPDSEVFTGSRTASQAAEQIQGLSTWGSLDVLEEIGHGAFGVVYRAWDPVLRRHVALKLFRSDQGQIEEARKLAQVNSPNIVKIFRYETHQGYPGFTMELVNGITLADEVKDRGPLSCAEAAEIGIALCKAVSAVHSAGLLHRDIKAQNVMREVGGRVVLMDFGLGVQIDNSDAEDSLAGTVPYMAPELFTGARASVSTDVYSLGVLLYFLVSGQYPVSAERVSGFREAHAKRASIPLREHSRSTKRGFARLIERAIAAGPGQRFASTDELRLALARWQRKKFRLRTVAVLSPVAATAFITAFYMTRPPAVPELKLTRITTDDGVSMEPSISADGQTIAYESDASGRGDFDIWVRRIDEATAHRVTDNPAHDTEPTLSPDGKLVAYHSNRSGGGIYIRSVSGGDERLLSHFGHDARFSPDGTEIVFWVGNDAQFATQRGQLFLVSASDGQTPHPLVPNFVDARLPVWSSDSNEILFQGCGPGCLDPEHEMDWWRIHRDGTDPVKTGVLPDVVAQGFSLYLGPVSWQHDKIVFSAGMEHGTNLFQIPISTPFWNPERKAVPLMSSTEQIIDPSMSRNGTIAFAGARSTVDLWRVPILGRGRNTVEPERLSRTFEIDSMPSVSADGNRFMYFGRIGTSRRMIIKTIKGSEVPPLNVPQPTRGIISASGDLIAYSVPGKDGRQVYIRQAPQWEAKKILESGGEVLDIFDQDRQLLIATKTGVFSLDITTRRQMLVLQSHHSTIDQAQISPDGSWIAFLSLEDANHSQIYVAPMQAMRIPEEQWIQVTANRSWRDKPRWTRDGRSIIFLSKEDDFLCIWRQELGAEMRNNGTPYPIAHMHRARVSPMYLSRNAFNLSVTEDMVFFNAADVTGSIWIAR